MLRRFMTALAVAVLSVSLVAGCGGDPIAAISDKVEGDPAPTVRVAYSYFNEDPLARFAVEVGNPAEDKTRIGVKVTWKALDADGVIVGTYDAAIGPIPAGGVAYYVGGAGGANLSGTPAQVKVEITDEGETVSNSDQSGLTVGKTEIKKAAYSVYEGLRTYEVSMVVTAKRDLSQDDISSAFVLRNKAGRIIGADFGDTTSVPASVSAGEKFKLTADVPVKNGTPVKVDASAWE